MPPAIDPWQLLEADLRTLIDWGWLALIGTRLLLAALLGGLLGIQRGHAGKAAGLRTHMLVTMGTAVFLLIADLHPFPGDGASRIIQGVAAGIGFIGGGVILRVERPREVHGLTTAAGIWLASGIGVAVGLGRLGLAVLSTLLGLLILSGLGQFEHALFPHPKEDVHVEE